VSEGQQKKKLLLATGNPKKGKELVQLCGGLFDVLTLAEVGLSDLIIVEDAETFEGNAKIKVKAVAAALRDRADETFDAILADDSGLCVDALGGGPGVRSARYALDGDAGEGDADNNLFLLKNLEGIPHDQRTARFHCAVAAMTGTKAWLQASGSVEGHIATDEVGAGGFGYDPLFIPIAYPDLRMAELSAADKHAISHRGKAMRKILDDVKEALGD
jgi:XTP/dITP diphosphohydrolase